MSPNLTSDQIEKLRSLGIQVDAPASHLTQQEDIPELLPETDIVFSPIQPLIILPKIKKDYQFKQKFRSYAPLLAISGVTLLSFSGIILLKNQNSVEPISAISPNATPVSATSVTPTGSALAIQSYLLSSQQYFTQALQLQKNASGSNEQVVNLLNQSILAASDAIKNYPNDYRGHYQRGRIYQSLLDSKPELITQSLADFSTASKLNPDSPDITRDMAALFAKQGDVANTLDFLSKTVSLEPTKAQNFYDLAKIQQQTGRVQDALSTYNRLIPLLTDPSQLAQVQAEKTTLEHIIAQNPNLQPAPLNPTTPALSPNPSISFPDNPPKLQASLSSGLIIAAPETSKTIEVDNVTNSNSLSGTSTLPLNTKEIILENSNLKPSSQIYLTIIKGGKNQNLQLLSKNGTTFKVGLDAPISENIEFKWWIIN